MKVLILIDGSNFYHMLRSRYGVSPRAIDWRRFPGAVLRRLPSASRHESVELRYYVGAVSHRDDPVGYTKQQVLFDAIRAGGGHVWTGRFSTRSRVAYCPTCRVRFTPTIACPQCGNPIPQEVKVEKGVDVKIAVDSVDAIATRTHDVVVLGSQDGDFIPVAHAVKALRGGVYCLSTPLTYAARKAGRMPALVPACTGAVWMTRTFLNESKLT